MGGAVVSVITFVEVVFHSGCSWTGGGTWLGKLNVHYYLLVYLKRRANLSLMVKYGLMMSFTQ